MQWRKLHQDIFLSRNVTRKDAFIDPMRGYILLNQISWWTTIITAQAKEQELQYHMLVSENKEFKDAAKNRHLHTFGMHKYWLMYQLFLYTYELCSITLADTLAHWGFKETRLYDAKKTST